MSNRHPNCKPMSILADTRPAVSMSGQTKRAQHSEIELLTRDFLASGGKVKQLDSQQASTTTRPAFNVIPGEYAA